MKTSLITKEVVKKGLGVQYFKNAINTSFLPRTFSTYYHILKLNKILQQANFHIFMKIFTIKMSKLFSSKFIQLLKTMNTEELKSFHEWLCSPWCNSNKNLIPLFEKVKKYHPDFNSNKLSKEQLFYIILPQGKYSSRRINNLLSEAFLAGRKFLVHQNLEKKQTRLQQELWAQETQSRYKDEWFFKDIKNILEEKTTENKSFEDHNALYRLNRMTYFHPSQNIRMNKGFGLITAMDKHLELLYLLEKAFIINEKIARSRILKDEQYKINKSIQNWKQVSREIDHTAINLYRLRFDFLEQLNRASYDQFRYYLISHINQLTPKEQKSHLLSLLNDSVLLIKKGLLDITETLELYQLGLQTGALINKGKLTLNTFISIVIASNTKGSFEYTQSFITKYTDYLNQSVQSDCMLWALAHTAYWKKDLEGSLSILREQEFKLLFFKYISRILLTQVYFDLSFQDGSYADYLENYLDNFEKWLSREKIWSDSQRQAFRSFVKNCRKLHRAYHAPDFDENKIRYLLDDEKNIQALNWLKQKQKQIIEWRKK